MRFAINLALALALGLPAALGAQAPDEMPACRATLDGDRLTTAIEFPDGYVVEAPWVVTMNRQAALEDGRPGMVVDARLDRIIEVDPRSGQRVTTPFPEPIETSFQGHTEEELVYQAAQVWCLTVLKVQEETAPGQPRNPASGRVGSRTETAWTGR